MGSAGGASHGLVLQLGRSLLRSAEIAIGEQFQRIGDGGTRSGCSPRPARLPGRRAVVPVEPRDALDCCRQQFVVAIDVLGVCVQPVGEQREMQVAVRTGEVVDFEALDLLLDRSPIGEQCRHGDKRAQMRRHAVGELQRRQEMGVEAETDRAIDQSDRRVEDGNRAEKRENDQRQGAEAGRGERDKRGPRRPAATAPIEPLEADARSPMQPRRHFRARGR